MKGVYTIKIEVAIGELAADAAMKPKTAKEIVADNEDELNEKLTMVATDFVRELLTHGGIPDEEDVSEEDINDD
jgi:hypothetical protein